MWVTGFVRRGLESLLVVLVVASFVGPLAAQDDALARLQARAVERYLKEIGSRDAEKRRDAARGLGGYEQPEAVAALATALADAAPAVREAAASSLWKTGAAAAAARPALERVLSDLSPAVRVKAAGALEAMGADPSTLVESRRSVLAEGDWFDQALAARDLVGHVPPAELVGPVLDSIRRTPPGSRSRFADPEDELSGASVLEPLAATADPTVVTALRAAIDEPGMPKAPLVDALATVEPEPERWLDALVAATRDPDAAVRKAAAEALEERAKRPEGGAGWPERVLGLLEDADQGVRWAAVEAFGAAGGAAHAAAPGLSRLVQSRGDDSFRVAAVRALGAIGDRAEPYDRAVKEQVAAVAAPALLAVIKADGDEDLRDDATEAYVGLAVDPVAQAGVLAELAEGSYPTWVRIHAVRAIGGLGRAAEGAIPALERLSRDPESLISSAATYGVEQIRRGAAVPAAVEAPAASQRPAVSGADVQAAMAWLRRENVDLTTDGLYRAIVERNADAVDALLAAGVSATDAGTTGIPPLHHALMSACQYGVRPSSDEARRIVASLLAHGADPNARDEQGNPALMRAAGVCDASIVGQLVAAGADIQAKNAVNMTAFALMVAMGDAEGAQALLDAGFRFSPEDAESVREWFADDPAKRTLLDAAGGKR